MTTAARDTHYLFDMRSSTIASAAPIDANLAKAQLASFGFESDATGGFVMNVPNGLDFDPSFSPTQTWADLTATKLTAIKTQFSGLNHVLGDHLADATGFDMTTASGVIAGGRGTFSFGDSGSAANITTNAVALGSTPTQAVLWLETYMYMPGINLPFGTPAAGYSNSKTTPFKRIMRAWDAVSGVFLQADVSFNNGSTYMTNVTPRQFFSIALADQGNTFKLRLTRKAFGGQLGRVGLACWALVY